MVNGYKLISIPTPKADNTFKLPDKDERSILRESEINSKYKKPNNDKKT